VRALVHPVHSGKTFQQLVEDSRFAELQGLSSEHLSSARNRFNYLRRLETEPFQRACRNVLKELQESEPDLFPVSSVPPLSSAEDQGMASQLAIARTGRTGKSSKTFNVSDPAETSPFFLHIAKGVKIDGKRQDVATIESPLLDLSDCASFKCKLWADGGGVTIQHPALPSFYCNQATFVCPDEVDYMDLVEQVDERRSAFTHPFENDLPRMLISTDIAFPDAIKCVRGSFNRGASSSGASNDSTYLDRLVALSSAEVKLYDQTVGTAAGSTTVEIKHRYSIVYWRMTVEGTVVEKEAVRATGKDDLVQLASKHLRI
jgi:hypothetical protein